MQNNKLENIQNKIFGKESEYNILDVYHYLMVSYGYINFEEFKKIDANLVNELVFRINKMNKENSSTGRRGKL